MFKSGGVGRRERKASRAVSSPGMQIALAALVAPSTGTDEGTDVVEPSREPTRSRTAAQQSRNAAGWTVDVSLRPSPPKRTGSVAWSHAASGTDVRVIPPNACRRPVSERDHLVAAALGGTVRRRWLILQMLRQLWRRCSATCGWSKSSRCAWTL